MTNKQLWYTRRGREIRGPFPKKLISRYLLIGRVVESDEVSVDQRNWKSVAQLPDLIPDEMKADLSIPENREKLRLARLREDERKYGDRRQLGDASNPNEVKKRRKGEDRRHTETKETLRHRFIKTRTSQLVSASKPNYRVTALVFSIFTALIIGIAVIYSPDQQREANNCAFTAQPQVDWSNCRFEGVRLAGVNLQGANLQNASLIDANLSDANLSGAQMSYGNLLNANMSKANLSESVLLGAVLRNTKLNAANLRHSDLHFAILHGADLTGADLSYADLSQAVLSGAAIDQATLNGAILNGAIWIDNSVCAPESIGKCLSKSPQTLGR